MKREFLKKKSNPYKQKMCKLARKQKFLIKKKFNKIHKLIIKELKLNGNHCIKIDRNPNLLQI
jgi:hypothetical protein